MVYDADATMVYDPDATMAFRSSAACRRNQAGMPRLSQRSGSGPMVKFALSSVGFSVSAPTLHCAKIIAFAPSPVVAALTSGRLKADGFPGLSGGCS